MADLRIPDVNKVFLAGRLTRDPELRYTNNHNPVTNFAVAVTRKYKTKGGDLREDTVFVDCDCWANTAEWVGTKTHKGDPVLVEGRLKQDEWEDKASGQTRRKLMVTADRVQALSWGDTGGAAEPQPQTRAETPAPDPDEDLPF